MTSMIMKLICSKSISELKTIKDGDENSLRGKSMQNDLLNT